VLPASLDVTQATAFVTADQSGPNEKLLGAYRLYIDGTTAGIGPGRADVPVSRSDHFVYDSVNVTGLIRGRAGDRLTLALQGFNLEGKGRMMLELHVETADGAKRVIATNSSWSTYNADKIYNPTSTTGGAYKAPREYIDANAVQAGWTMAGFLPGNGWSPAKAQASFGTAMVAKQTLPLSVSYVTPNVTAVSPGVWFIDFGTEVMAGLSITVTNGAKGQQLDLQLGEELTGPHTILVPMRTVSVCWVPAALLLLPMAFAFDAICPSRMPCDPCKTGMAAARHRDIGWMRTLRLLMQLYVCFMFAGQHLPEHFYAGGRDLPP